MQLPDWTDPKVRADAVREAAERTVEPLVLDTVRVTTPAQERSKEALSRGVAVVTGQQAGLFGGPLYTLHKAAAAIVNACRLEEETGVPVAPVFWAFRTMVGVGLLMLAVSWLGVWQVRKRGLQPWLARALVGMTFSGWVALLAGWYVTEIGRQPWLVQGVLKTAQAASQVPAHNIAFTLTMYLVLYVALLMAYVSVVFYLARKAAKTEMEVSHA